MTVNSESNAQKSEAGRENKSYVLELCDALQKRNLITSYKENFKVAHKNHKIKQYKCDVLIKDLNDDPILIYTSTSVRTDRLKKTYWEAQGVIENEFNGSENVAAVIFVVNDEAAETNDFKYQKGLKDNNEIYSPITHFFSESEFNSFFESWSNQQEEKQSQNVFINSISEKLINAININSAHDSIGNTKESGSRRGKRGNLVEEKLLECLNDRVVLDFYLKEKVAKEGNLVSDLIYKILSVKNIDVSFVDSFSARKRIKLDVHGLAKPDLQVNVNLKDGSTHIVNISVKVSDQSVVACHDYPANAFIETLLENDRSKNPILAQGLEDFQLSGSWKDYENTAGTENYEAFYKELFFNIASIYDWAVAGKYKGVQKELIVDLILYIKPNDNDENITYRLYTVDEYKRILFREKGGEKRGKPFSWTYPSKQRGKRIQLKLPLIY